LKELARREGRTVDAIASDLFRSGLAQNMAAKAQEVAGRHGLHPFIADGRVTNEQVNRLRDDLGI
jgi:hypothetical protein